MRRHWRDPHFWRWWWNYRLSGDAKIWALIVGLGALAAGGYLAAAGLNGEVTASSNLALPPQVTTVQRLVTIRKDGRVVTKPIRVVQTLAGRASTAYATEVRLNTVTTPGRMFVVTQREVRDVPVVRRQVVTIDGRSRTVFRTAPASTQTRTAVVTDQRTVTHDRVVTNERVLTSERVVTNERVVTQPVTTTRIVTDTVPVTVPSTETIYRTETETLPASTILVTVPETITVTVRKP